MTTDNRELRAEQRAGAHRSILFGAKVFKFSPDFIKGGLISIDGSPGTVNTFNAPDGEGDCAQGDHIVCMGHFIGIDGPGCAGNQDPHEGLFVIKFSLDVILRAFTFGMGEGIRIEAVLGGVGVAARGTVVESVGVTRLAAAV